jgi:hypothetical protein
MNSLEVYNKCVIDLDKYETPTFEIEVFNRMAERAIYEYINTKYKEFELIQKRTDDLRQFVKVSEIAVSNVSSVNLPVDYLRLLKLEYRLNDNECYINKWVVAKKTTADKLGYSESNYYWKPSIINPQYQFIGDAIWFRLGDDANSIINRVRLEYLYIPEFYTINPLNMSDFTNPPYSDEVDNQIIDIICRIYLAETNPNQYQVKINESQFKNN